MYQQIYKNGAMLEVTNQQSMWFKDKGEVIDFDSVNDRYKISIRTNLYSIDEWFDFEELYPVYSGVTQTPSYGILGANTYSVGIDYSFSNSRCNHKWVCDYKSIFTNQEYYSCSKCKIKREEWEKQNQDDGVPF